MIVVDLADLNIEQRTEELREHIGKQVRATANGDRTIVGTLRHVNGRRITIDANERCVSTIKRVVIAEGGDWTTRSGTSATALTARLTIRLHPNQKHELGEAAKRAGTTLSDLVLTAALSSARDGRSR